MIIKEYIVRNKGRKNVEEEEIFNHPDKNYEIHVLTGFRSGVFVIRPEEGEEVPNDEMEGIVISDYADWELDETIDGWYQNITVVPDKGVEMSEEEKDAILEDIEEAEEGYLSFMLDRGWDTLETNYTILYGIDVEIREVGPGAKPPDPKKVLLRVIQGRAWDFREYLNDHADDSLWADREFMLELIKSLLPIGSWIEPLNRIFDHASDSLKTDREFMLEAVRNYGGALEFASDTFKADRELVLEAVRNNGRALKFASDTFKADREVMIEAVRNDGTVLSDASDTLKADCEVVIEAVKKWAQALQYASDTLKADREVVLEAVKTWGISLQYASDTLKADREVVIEAVRNDGWALENASDSFKADREVVIEAIRSGGGYALKFASEELQNDPELKKLAEGG